MLLGQTLELGRCPHCGVSKPLLAKNNEFDTRDHEGGKKRWCVYVCSRCGGVVSAWALPGGSRVEVEAVFPQLDEVSDRVPPPAREYLRLAQESIHSPAGAVLLCGSAVDAMLKAHGHREGSLNSRMDQAKDGGIITEDIAAWARTVRLDAGDQLNLDEESSMPSRTDAERSLDFTMALAEILFVLPARVKRGMAGDKRAMGGGKKKAAGRR